MKHCLPLFMVIALTRVRHSLITIFADTSEGGGFNILLQESGSALLQEDNSFLILE